jgi:hypothetical protein
MATLGPQLNGRAHSDRIDIGVSFGSLSLRERYRHVKVYIVHITPSLAEMYLHGNVKNRPLTKSHVDQMRQILVDGDMVMNGEAIIIGSDGSLLNGQHRLTACVQSGVGFDAMVVEGIDLKAFRTMDGGKKRSVGDVIATEGEINANQLSAAIQALYTFVQRNGCVISSTGGSHTRKITPSIAERILKSHPHIRRSVTAMSNSKLYRNQDGVLLHNLFSLVSTALAEEFCAVIEHGSEDIGRPFVLLRESLIVNRGRTDLRTTTAAKAIKAFNAERSGDRPKLLRLRSGEEFPRIDGLDYDALFASVK